MKEEGLSAGKNYLQEWKVKSFYRRLWLTLDDEGLHILYINGLYIIYIILRVCYYIYRVHDCLVCVSLLCCNSPAVPISLLHVSRETLLHAPCMIFLKIC